MVNKDLYLLEINGKKHNVILANFVDLSPVKLRNLLNSKIEFKEKDNLDLEDFVSNYTYFLIKYQIHLLDDILYIVTEKPTYWHSEFSDNSPLRLKYPRVVKFIKINDTAALCTEGYSWDLPATLLVSESALINLD